MIQDSLANRTISSGEFQSGISVIVPVYNSQSTLTDLVEELSEVLVEIGKDFEIVLVNDGSADGSWERIKCLAEDNSRVLGINLSRNYGQHNATLCGLRVARFGISVTMDDDLQHPPGEIPRLLSHLGEGCDVIYGRPLRKRHSWMRNLLTRLTKSVVGRATGLRRVMEQSPFRALKTRLRFAFDDYQGPDVLLDVLLGWGTTKFCSVPVEHHPRRHGRSTYTAARLLDMGILVLTAYSTAPLRFASWVGFSLTAFGVAVLTYVVILAVFFGSVPGFPFLASLISIFSGAQLFALGLFGEYLTRIFNRALGRPTYVVKETAEQPGGRDRRGKLQHEQSI